MSLNEAKNRWGIKTFDVAEFKKSDPIHRAPMAVDALKRQLFVGKDIKVLRQDLGEPDGYFLVE